MKLKTTVATSFLLASTSVFAVEDIIVENHTDIYGTAKLKYSLCSSYAGDRGMLKPHENLIVPKSVEETYCYMGCNVEIYASKNCSGNSIFTIHIDRNNGVNNITSHNSKYHITGSGHDIIVEDGATFKSWWNKLFG